MYKNYKNAFTMVELVFVIVVLGILAAIAIPRMAATRDDAQVAKGRSELASIRAAIVSERQQRMLKGQNIFITQLHSSSSNLFDGNGSSTLLQYPIQAQNANGHWHSPNCGGASPNRICTYQYKVMNTDNTFTYDQSDGTFRCTGGAYCDQLAN